MQKYIKTNRLEISAMVKRDLPDLNSLLSSLKLRELSGLQMPVDDTNRMLALTLLAGDEFIFVIRLITTGELIGLIGFYKCYQPDFSVSTGFRELGYLLAENMWGNGYMTEVGDKLINEFFKDTNYKYLCAGIMPNNHRSQRVLTKLKFVQSLQPDELTSDQFGPKELYFQRTAE
ncbi:hypothetical protein LOOC260_105090 [Paucilactobacillus hokkaidonensis JCM 18461]|uniref:N-acetyltransferase domain-containing protein n=2 Tax=Paucilactobacillus hokkaidonensis TaxID=1193095 RepID=A0A0A1GRZ5_9LACO|nr:GNAT family N-acetyltransferase [Paucilactobacillus hokkaidonensis]KRO11376.1 hypothetical protein IV59_GL000116 [Paucilactobacillus hokkaidonensis]BAP85072.1 hypothetical protein LOOC260_105090 [Paucilactobacillus hokkaidonensis JCM 18461]